MSQLHYMHGSLPINFEKIICQIEHLQKISFAHILMILDDKLSVLFYDVTTLYLEAIVDAHLRKTDLQQGWKT